MLTFLYTGNRYDNVQTFIYHTCTQGNMSSRVSINLELFSEFLEILEEMFWYYMHSDICSRCIFLNTPFCVTYRQKVDNHGTYTYFFLLIDKVIYIKISLVNLNPLCTVQINIMPDYEKHCFQYLKAWNIFHKSWYYLV